MRTIKQNKAECDRLLQMIKDHPMSAKIMSDQYSIMVIFPDGMPFHYNGVHASFSGGKIKALQQIIEKLEWCWIESFPGGVPT